MLHDSDEIITSIVFTFYLFLCHLHVKKDVVDQLFDIFLHQHSVTWILDQSMNKVEDAKNEVLKSKNFTFNTK